MSIRYQIATMHETMECLYGRFDRLKELHKKILEEKPYGYGEMAADVFDEIIRHHLAEALKDGFIKLEDIPKVL